MEKIKRRDAVANTQPPQELTQIYESKMNRETYESEEDFQENWNLSPEESENY